MVEERDESESRAIEEIDLGYTVARAFQIVTKYWKQIAVITILCSLAAVVYCLHKPHEYELSVVMEPGLIGKDTYNRPLYNDTGENLGTKIRRGTYNPAIIEALGLDPGKYAFDFGVSYNKEQNAVRVSLITSDVTTGTLILKSLVEQVTKEKYTEYKALVDSIDIKIGLKENEIKELEARIKELSHQIDLKQNKIGEIGNKKEQLEQDINNEKNKMLELQAKKDETNQNIEIKQSEIAALNGKIVAAQNNTKSTQERIKAIDQDLDRVLENTKRIESERESLLKSADKAPEPIALLLFNSTIQENITYYNMLLNQRHTLEKDLEKYSAEIKEWQSEIKQIEAEIEQLKIYRDQTLAKQEKDVQVAIGKLEITKDKSLETEIRNYKVEIATLEDEINIKIPVEMDSLRKEIEDLRVSKELIYPLRVVQAPAHSPQPVGPSKQQTVLIVAIVALVISYFFFASREVLRSYLKVSRG